MQAYWENKARNWTPLLSFTGSTVEEYEKWQLEARDKLKEILGDFPEKVPLNAEIEYSLEDNGIIRERVIFDSEDFMSVPCYVLRPKDMKADKSNAAIICSHGHGAYGDDIKALGKEPVAGVRSTDTHEQDIRFYNYNFAEQMARAGFVTIAPDLRAFGERNDGANLFPGRDSCNVNFIQGALLGLYTLTLNIWDMKCCIDYLETRCEVDPERIGMMGLSYGGTMTAFTAAVDERIKAADIMGYINPWEEFAIKNANFCGSQIVPEVYKYFETHDIAGLIAPRPILLEMGIYDSCFYIQDQLKGYEGVKQIYKAAGAEDSLYKEIFPGPHAFAGNKAFEFFKKHL